eukprot:g1956.t1
MSTGDFHNNVVKLARLLRHINYPHATPNLKEGSPQVVLPLLHYVFLEYSRHVARVLTSHNFELRAKNDADFAADVLRVMRRCFNQQPRLKKTQLLATGYAEQKVIFLCDCIRLCRAKHEACEREEKTKLLRIQRAKIRKKALLLHPLHAKNRKKEKPKHHGNDEKNRTRFPSNANRAAAAAAFTRAEERYAKQKTQSNGGNENLNNWLKEEEKNTNANAKNSEEKMTQSDADIEVDEKKQLTEQRHQIHLDLAHLSNQVFSLHSELQMVAESLSARMTLLNGRVSAIEQHILSKSDETKKKKESSLDDKAPPPAPAAAHRSIPEVKEAAKVDTEIVAKDVTEPSGIEDAKPARARKEAKLPSFLQEMKHRFKQSEKLLNTPEKKNVR